MRSVLARMLSMVVIATSGVVGWASLDAAIGVDPAVTVVQPAEGILIERVQSRILPVAAPEVLDSTRLGAPPMHGIRRAVVVDNDGELVTTWPTPSWTYGDAELSVRDDTSVSSSVAARVVPPGGGIQAATATESAGRGPQFVPGTPPTATPTPTTTPAGGTTTTLPTTPTTIPQPGSPTTTTLPTAGTTTTVASTSFDLSLDRFYINQAVPVLDTSQSAGDRIRPVGRRGGLARAFVSANRSNSVRPEVELHWRHPSGATGVVTLGGPAATPTTPSEATLGSTFNDEFGSNVLLPGTEVYVVVDPRNLIAEANESNNRWPSQGWANANVADVPELEITWVPVIWEGVQGNINAGNVAQYEDSTMRMMPIPGVDSQIHSPIVFNGNLRTGSGWSQLLNQIAQLRAAEGSDRAYHAIVRRPGNNGIAGIGFVGFEVGVSFDSLPAASGVVAHELGHNFGLPHAPCGSVGSFDPNYPYSNGQIGSWGYDLVDNVAVDPSSNVRDIMTYCNPAWISDYHFQKVLTNRLTSASRRADFSGTALHVTGNVVDGVATIEPTYALDEGGVEPVAGEYTLVGTDDAGAVLFEVPFTAYEAGNHGEAHDHDEYFSFSVPVTDELLAQLASLTVEHVGEAIGQRRSSSSSLRIVEPAEQQANADGTTTVTWDSSAEVAVVRDATTGEVLAVSNDGSAEIVATDAEVEVVLSDGMGTTTSEMVAP